MMTTSPFRHHRTGKTNVVLSYRIVIVTDAVPSAHGGAQNAYNLHRVLTQLGYRTCLVCRDPSYTRHDQAVLDPARVNGVVHEAHRFRVSSHVRAFLDTFFNHQTPHLIMARHLHPVFYAKRLYPNVPCLYMCSATPVVQVAIHVMQEGDTQLDVVQDMLHNRVAHKKWLHALSRKVNGKLDRRAMTMCDWVICGSELASRIQCRAYEHDFALRQKILGVFNFATVSRVARPHLASVPLFQRRFLCVVVISDLQRRIKNAELALRILCHPLLRDHEKVLIGRGATQVIDHTTANTFHVCPIEHMPNEQLITTVLAQSKCTLVTSVYDCNPNLVQESISVRTIPFVTCNVGGSGTMSYPKTWYVSPATDVSAWVTRLQTLAKCTATSLPSHKLADAQVQYWPLTWCSPKPATQDPIFKRALATVLKQCIRS